MRAIAGIVQRSLPFTVRRQRAVVGEHDLVAVAKQDVDALSLERVDVLREDEGLGAFADDGIGGQHEDVVQLLDPDAQPHLLARPESPEDLRPVAVLDGLVLVFQRHQEREGAVTGSIVLAMWRMRNV